MQRNAQASGESSLCVTSDFCGPATAVSGIGNGVTTVVLPLIALRELDASSFQIGVLASAVWLPWLIVGLPAGAWIDRLPSAPDHDDRERCVRAVLREHPRSPASWRR